MKKFVFLLIMSLLCMLSIESFPRDYDVGLEVKKEVVKDYEEKIVENCVIRQCTDIQVIDDFVYFNDEMLVELFQYEFIKCDTHLNVILNDVNYSIFEDIPIDVGKKEINYSFI